MKDINLNILQLACMYPNEFGDIISKPQRLYIKAMTFSDNSKSFIYSDSVLIDVLPLSEMDKIVFDLLQKTHINPTLFTCEGQLLYGYSPESHDRIISEYPKSVFADLARISYVLCLTGILRRGTYTPEKHAQAKQYLSAIRHTEFSYIRYWIGEIEKQLLEKEKQGF